MYPVSPSKELYVWVLALKKLIFKDLLYNTHRITKETGTPGDVFTSNPHKITHKTIRCLLQQTNHLKFIKGTLLLGFISVLHFDGNVEAQFICGTSPHWIKKSNNKTPHCPRVTKRCCLSYHLNKRLDKITLCGKCTWITDNGI